MLGTSKTWASFGKRLSAPLAIGATAVVAYTDAFHKVREIWHEMPYELRWGIGGGLAVAVIALIAALASKKSVLRRPDRFRVPPHDPRYLIGREQELADLCSECETQGLVFLVGESGAGKSSLIDAGLLPFYADTATNRPTSPLIPILIDAAGLAWDGGIRHELARKIGSLTTEQIHLIGADAVPKQDNPFALLGSLAPYAPSKLLIVLDQIDDYLLEHSSHFLHRRKVISADRLMSLNPDWELLSYAIRTKRVHVIIVGRSDAVMLDALQICPYTKFVLSRLDPHLIRPLFELITKSEPGDDVVESPANGWSQLKARLLRDLSASGQVLPMQLVIALDSLRRLRYLTTSEYVRSGGLLGLERLYIERHASDISREAGLDRNRVLHALLRLTTEDGSKTCRMLRPEFVATAIGESADSDISQRLIDHLARNRLVRTQTGREGEFLMLYHDYLARGVIASHRHQNRWTEQLRVASRDLKQASTWSQKWAALLNVRTLLSLSIARLLGHFHFGEHRRVAALSLLRTVPFFIAAAISISIWGWATGVQERHEACNQIAQLAAEGTGQFDPKAWESLAGASEAARVHAAAFALSRPTLARTIAARADLFVHSLAGLDPLSAVSSRLVDEALLPALTDHHDSVAVIHAVGAFAKQLEPSEVDVHRVATLLAKGLAESKDRSVQSEFATALKSLTPQLSPQHRLQLARSIAARAEMSTAALADGPVSESVERLTAGLNPPQCSLVIGELVTRLSDDSNHRQVSRLIGDLVAGGGGEKCDDYATLARASLHQRQSADDSGCRESCALAAMHLARVVPPAKQNEVAADIMAQLSAGSGDSIDLLPAAIAVGAFSSTENRRVAAEVILESIALANRARPLSTLLWEVRQIGLHTDGEWIGSFVAKLIPHLDKNDLAYERDGAGQLLIAAFPYLSPRDQDLAIEAIDHWTAPKYLASSFPSTDGSLLAQVANARNSAVGRCRRRIAESYLRHISRSPTGDELAAFGDEFSFCAHCGLVIQGFSDQLSSAEREEVRSVLLSRMSSVQAIDSRILLEKSYRGLRLHTERDHDARWVDELATALLNGLGDSDPNSSNGAFELALSSCEGESLDSLGILLARHIELGRPLAALTPLFDAALPQLSDLATECIALAIIDRMLGGGSDEVISELRDLLISSLPRLSVPSLDVIREKLMPAGDVPISFPQQRAFGVFMTVSCEIGGAFVSQKWELLLDRADEATLSSSFMSTESDGASFDRLFTETNQAEMELFVEAALRCFADPKLRSKRDAIANLLSRQFSSLSADRKLQISEWLADCLVRDLVSIEAVAYPDPVPIFRLLSHSTARRLVAELAARAESSSVPRSYAFASVIAAAAANFEKSDIDRLVESAYQRMVQAEGTAGFDGQVVVLAALLQKADARLVATYVPLSLRMVESFDNYVQQGHASSIIWATIRLAPVSTLPSIGDAVCQRRERGVVVDSGVYMQMLNEISERLSGGARRTLVVNVVRMASKLGRVGQRVDKLGMFIVNNWAHLSQNERRRIGAGLFQYLSDGLVEVPSDDSSNSVREVPDELSVGECALLANAVVEHFRDGFEEKSRRSLPVGLDRFTPNVEKELSARITSEWLSIQAEFDSERGLDEQLQVRVRALSRPSHSLEFHSAIYDDIRRLLGMPLATGRRAVMQAFVDKGLLRKVQMRYERGRDGTL